MPETMIEELRALDRATGRASAGARRDDVVARIAEATKGDPTADEDLDLECFDD
jgi:hypothetical protein